MCVWGFLCVSEDLWRFVVCVRENDMSHGLYTDCPAIPRASVPTCDGYNCYCSYTALQREGFLLKVNALPFQEFCHLRRRVGLHPARLFRYFVVEVGATRTWVYSTAPL